jgi:hypothetical protein
MAQLSRPYQIALAATVFLALVWFVALRPHSTSSSSTPVASAPASTPAPTAASAAKAAAAPSKIYHGAAPGVEGLTRAINHAHGAVAASQKQAQRLERTSTEATGQGAGASASTANTGSKQAAGPASTTVETAKGATVTSSKHAAARASTTVVTKHVGHSTGAPPTAVHSGIPANQATVEGELKKGKVVLVLFWNPKGVDDVAVRKELQAVEKQQGRKIAVHYAFANQVGSFGSITKAIQVYQTPTILMVNGKGLTTTLTGFTDAFSIEQTIDEARQAS